MFNKVLMILGIQLCMPFFSQAANFANFFKKDTSYISQNVNYAKPDTSINFGATLTIPDTSSRNPVVIIVSGTGPQDRDGTMAGHKMFAVLADYLSKRGIAVLRVDDRGVGQTTGNYETSTTADFASDVLTSIDYLKTRKDIDIQKIGLIGHSEGGAVISIAASQSKDIAFLVSIAGLATNGLDALLVQNEDIVASAPIPDRDKKRYNEINSLMFQTAYKYANSDSMEQKLNETYNSWKQKDDEFVKSQHIDFDHFRFPIYSYVHQATGAWYRFFIQYDPAKYLSKVNVPILALNGDKDLMVACDLNLENWKKYGQLSGNKNITTVKLEGLNHLFLHCTTCTQQEYSSLKEDFSPEALKIISDWVQQQVKR
jgi:uncharacterized protein